MRKTQRALVIGGGIAGPVHALLLARGGFEPIVCEAYPRTDDVGGGFQIAPNGLRVFAELGLTDALFAEGHPSRNFCFRNSNGKTVGVANTSAPGAALNVMRAPLHRIVRDEAERRGIAIRYEKRLREIALAGDEVVATFEDGSTEVGDFLVGADGVHSRVRAWMLPDHAKPRDTRMIGIGGFCPKGFAPPAEAADADRLTFLVGPKHQLGYSKMSASQWGWWCHAYAETDAERAEILALPASTLKTRMLDRYEGWCAPTCELIASTEGWLRTPIHDVPSLPTWHRGRVILIGDAAHAMSPAAGQGASFALEDAMVLARMLGKRDAPLDATFARFESARKARAEAMIKQGYENDRRTLNEVGPVGAWMRDHVFMPMLLPVIARALNRVYTEPLPT